MTSIQSKTTNHVKQQEKNRTCNQKKKSVGRDTGKREMVELAEQDFITVTIKAAMKNEAKPDQNKELNGRHGTKRSF